jgi:hypothetical protein
MFYFKERQFLNNSDNTARTSCLPCSVTCLSSCLFDRTSGHFLANTVFVGENFPRGLHGENLNSDTTTLASTYFWLSLASDTSSFIAEDVSDDNVERNVGSSSVLVERSSNVIQKTEDTCQASEGTLRFSLIHVI